MTVGQLRTIVIDCLDPTPLATFWAQFLGVDVAYVDEEWIALHSPATGHPRLAFQKVPESKVTKNRLHLDLWVQGIRTATVAARGLGAVRVGGLVLDGPEPFQVMRDPAGNEFCLVHRPGSDGP